MKQKTLNQWSVNRTRPYTQKGIGRLRCIRCGNPAEYQWQICADGNNYRPVCGPCDFELNALVLRWMRHPQAKELMKEYER